MIDPEMKYCPSCKDEYRPEIAQCGVCGRPLVMGVEYQAQEQGRLARVQNRRGALQPGDDLVTIHKAPLKDIKPLEAQLTRENIGFLLVGDEHGCGKGCCPSNFELRVRREEARDAFLVLEQEHQRSTGLASHNHEIEDHGFNPEAGEATCPACGYRFSTATTTCPDCGLCFG